MFGRKRKYKRISPNSTVTSKKPRHMMEQTQSSTDNGHESTSRSNLGGISRVLNKLHTSLDNGDYYEAHQMYRTLYFRYLNQKKQAEMLELVFDGASRLLALGQLASGADLAQLYADSLLESEVAVDGQIVDNLGQLFCKLPASPVPSAESGGVAVDRAKFLDASLKWSKEMSQPADYQKRGHAGLHTKVAEVYWKEKNFTEARKHYLLSDDTKGCASLLIEYQSTKGYKGELDLFVGQAVLQLLCIERKTQASQVLTQYTRGHPQIQSDPPFKLPLLNFLWFLLLAVDVGKVQVFTILVERYKPSLERDPVYFHYLDKIGQLFFGLPPPAQNTQQGPGGFLSNLIQGLMGDSDNESGFDAGDELQGSPTLKTDETLD